MALPFAMPIEVCKDGDRYTASVTPPHGGGQAWATPEPLTAQDLVEQLLALGCHQTDVGDAMYAADRGWLNEG